MIAANLQATVQKNIPLVFSRKTQTRDLRLVSNLKKDTPYAEKRGNVKLCGGDKVVIKADSESVIIDNLGQLFEIQRELIIT